MKYLQSEAREKEQTAFQKGWKITIIKVNLDPDCNSHDAFTVCPENAVDVCQMQNLEASLFLRVMFLMQMSEQAHLS